MVKLNCSKIAKFVFISLITPLFVVAYFSSQKAQAQMPSTINFQGKIVRNDSGYEGMNVTTGSPACVQAGADTCDFQVKYYSASSGGTLFLTETFVDKEIGQYGGVFELSLGSGSITAGSHSTLDEVIQKENTIYIEIGFSPAGNSTFTETFTRMYLQANAFAIRSKYSEMAKGAFKFENAPNSSGYSGSDGMVYYDTTTGGLKLYSAGVWLDISTGTSSSLWGTDSISSYSHNPSQFLETSGIATLSNFGLDTTVNRAWIHGASSRTGFSVYSNYGGATDWPLVTFKADASNFGNSILQLIQDGTGSILEGYKGTNKVFDIDNRGDMHLSSDGILYFEPFSSLPSSGNLFPGSGEGCLYSAGGNIYWDSGCDASSPTMLNAISSSLWTDAGSFTYLTSTGDNLVLGGNSVATATFFFDMTGASGRYFRVDNYNNTETLFTIDSSGNVGIGTAAPGAKLDIGGSSANISNAIGDITIIPAQNLIISQGNVGIGNSSPTSLLSVGSSSQFQVDTNGDLVKIKNLTYSWPTAHATSGLLSNNGSGTLTWNTPADLGLSSGTGVAGQITFWSGTSTISGDNNLWWDNVNKRLGIGTTTPQATIDIAGATSEIANTAGDITISPANNLIVSGGNLGINTTSVSKTLTVAGNMKMYFTNTGTSSTNIFDTTYTQSVAAPAGTIYGYYNKANYTATGTMLEMGAAKYDAQNDSTGTVTRLYTLDVSVFNKTTGTVTTAAAIHARGFQEAYAGTISALHGVLVDNAHKGSGGTITGQSGLTVAPLTSGTNNTHLLLGTTTIPTGNYAIYSGSSYESLFSGIVTVNGAGSSSGIRLAGGGTKMYTDGTNGAIRMVPGNGWFAVRNGADTVNTLLVSSSYTQVYSKLGIGTSSTISLAIGDSDTGLNWISDGNLAVYTNNVERMRIGSNGNVGIGVTDPKSKLHISRGLAIGPNQTAINTTYGAMNSIQLLTQNSIGGGTYTDHTGAILWSTLESGGWGDGRLKVAISTNWGTYNTSTPALSIGQNVSTVSGQFIAKGSAIYNQDSAISGFGPVCGYFGASANVSSVCLATPATYPGVVFYSNEGYRADIQKIGGDLRFRTYDQTGSNPTLVFYASANSNVYGNAGFIANAFDLAEYAKTSELNLSPGDVVSFVPNSKEKIEGTKGLEYVPAGVISTKPGLVMGNGPIDNIAEEDKRENDPSWKLLALIGRVPVKISLSPGEVINVNDYLDVSSIPRYAKKQTSAGLALGKAMETFNPSLLSCTPVSSASSISWPADEGHNESKPCYVLPDGTYVGKVMMFVNVSWYDPSISSTTETLTESGWYRISELNNNDDYAKIKVNNSTLGSSQNLILSVDTVGGNNNVNVISNFTTGGYDISKARINTVNGIKYLEIYLGAVNSNSIKVSIDGDNTNWIATNIVKVEDGIGIVEYAFNGVLFGISDNFAVSEDGISTAGTLLTSGLTSDIGNSGNRWNDIYTKGTIRLGSGSSEGGIRYNVEKKRLEFSNDGINWVEMGDLTSNVVISPEYSGAILYADGSDNHGRMTSDAINTGGVFKNYYEWKSDRETLQDYDILVRITLPSDFVSWKEDAISLDFMTENSASIANNKVEIALMGDSGIDSEIKNGISKMPGSWERISIKAVDITQCKKAGDSCTLRLSMYSKENYYVRVGDISLNYNRGL